jgi:hypothetical protein
MSDIQDAVAQAQAAAQQMVDDEANQAPVGQDVVEGSVGAGGAVQTYSKPSMSSVAAATGLLPRSTLYLKPTEHGMKVGKNKDMLQDFEASVLLVEDKGFQLKYTVRYGNPAQYLSSYDGVTCNKGGSWAAAMQKANMAGPNDPYTAAEIKLVLTKELKLKEETLPVGTIIGYDTSAPSRFSDWSDFFETAQTAGVVGEEVKVKVIAREINHNGNNWGTIAFELA